jgi:hypothetical protein
MTDKPTVVRGVHYVSAGHSLGVYNSTCRAAIVTDVKDENTISVAVFTPHGTLFYDDITHDEGKAGGTWHWPEREEAPTSSILPANFIAPPNPGDSKPHKA